MPAYSHTLEIDAPPHVVFAFLEDVARTPEWLERCTGIDILTPGPIGVGTELRYHYRDRRQAGTMAGVVVNHEEGRRIAMTYTDKIMDVTVDFAADDVPEARTSLTHAITIHTKGMGKVFGPVIARQLPGQTIRAMTALKGLIEGTAGKR